jgi:tannase/feruloyl esterase
MIRSYRPASLVTVVSLLCLAHSSGQTQSPPPVAYGPSCSALAGVLIASATVTFTRRFAPGTFDPRQPTQQTPSAAPPFRDLPEFCRVELTAGSSSAFRSAEVWIPTQSWNGKLMMVGRNQSGTSFDFGRMAVALSGGFTTASLDGATPAAIHEATSFVNQLLVTYLGPEARWIYWSGCAASARDGLVAADRYPGDFDGILAGGLSEAVPPVAGDGRTPPQLGLEAYRARGGKVLVYDTSADAASALLPRGNDAIRVVLTPGQPNCPDVDDGRTAGMVRALESWVERGKTSDQTGAQTPSAIRTAPHRLEIDDGRAVNRFEPSHRQRVTVNGEDCDAVQADRIGPIRRTRAEHSRQRPRHVVPRMHFQNRPIGLVQPGEKQHFHTGTEALEPRRELRKDVDSGVRRSLIALLGRLSGILQAGSNVSDRANVVAAHASYAGGSASCRISSSPSYSGPSTSA